MAEAQMLRHEGILSTNIAIKGTLGEWARSLLVGRGRGLAVAKESWDDNEVLVGVERFVFSN